MYGIDFTVPGGYTAHAVQQQGALPRTLEVGKDAGLTTVPVSDDVAAAETAGTLETIELRIKIENLADHRIDLTINGHTPKEVGREEDWLVCHPEASMIRRGRNRIGLDLQDRAGGATERLPVTDVQLWIRYR